MGTKTLTLHDIKKQTREEIADCIQEKDVGEYPEDRINEIVDSNMPIYTYEILQVALRDIDLAVIEPEIYGFDGIHNAVNAIVGNIYDAVYEDAMEYYHKLIYINKGKRKCR